ncbi:hypothetical protein CNECB9_750010 [Cupriavidus necator]|uniref:Uncharacterized protein n=1 Tax=Cupriavidus necator TaxID=106590 RepID=A0A1K0JQX0_CUPNE|nr:hypothetical protein CNECB9_750010 [Cupriavidus necator]
MSLDHSPEATPGSVMSRHWLDLERVKVYSIAMLIIYCGMIVLWGLRTKGFTADSVARPGVDFSAFWSASYLALKGHAVKVYDYETLRPVIAAFGAVKGGGAVLSAMGLSPDVPVVCHAVSLVPVCSELPYLHWQHGGHLHRRAYQDRGHSRGAALRGVATCGGFSGCP